MKIKRLISVVVILVLVLTVGITSTYAEKEKNETVYAVLNYDGSVNDIYVVNQLFGEYVDYGEYTDVKNLSTDSTPTIDGDRIAFEETESQGGLYYQGTMIGELPMTFDIEYFIDGEQVAGENLGGESGHLKITIDFAVNEKCDAQVSDAIMAQIMLTLNMDIADNIEVNNGTSVIVGNTMTVNYTALLGESGTATLEADVTDFEMAAISISMLKNTFTLDGYEDTIDEFKDGFADMEDGMVEMIDGTTELKDGTVDLIDGIGDLKNGLRRLKSSGGDFADGMTVYGDGLGQYLYGVTQLEPGSAQFDDALNALAQNGGAVSNGVSQISDGLSQLAGSTAELEALATALLSSTDPSVQALAAGTLETLATLEALSGGLNTASNGVSEYVGGVSEIAIGYGVFHEGIVQLSSNADAMNVGFEQIASGYNEYLTGVSKSSSGMSKLYASIKTMPDDVQLLIDGQVDFKDGISEASELIDDELSVFSAGDSAAVSFTSPEKNNPASVQYVLTTPEIRVNEQVTKEDTTVKQENFFTRFADLFR
ncbi:MAG: hypothetical protein HN948_08450 [Clostridia bacterium]|jgi:putative membrane protein|nr:hypothetical protein [Clostridia bacterium]MBT7123022.1 hypothetical protein [Clostridia bacterium]